MQTGRHPSPHQASRVKSVPVGTGCPTRPPCSPPCSRGCSRREGSMWRQSDLQAGEMGINAKRQITTNLSTHRRRETPTMSHAGSGKCVQLKPNELVGERARRKPRRTANRCLAARAGATRAAGGPELMPLVRHPFGMAAACRAIRLAYLAKAME